MKKWLSIAIILILAVIAGLLVIDSKQKAPEATFTTIDGKVFHTSDLKGKVTLVKFWATSCSTCVQQMPMMISDYEKYHNQGYQAIAVAMSYDPIQFVRNFTHDKKLPFTVVSDTDGLLAKAFGRVQFTPVAFLIDRHGNILKRFVGAYNHKSFDDLLKKALAQN